jgi:DNA-binding NarL/FixJ family response regulator
MRRADPTSGQSTLLHSASTSPAEQHPEDLGDLSDREAVVAVMVANGLPCDNIAVRLALTLEQVEEHLQHALEILGLSHIEDLTYVIVAAHYNRNAPRTHPPARPQTE